jgi:putative SOS response-associated peptidase YedK
MCGRAYSTYTDVELAFHYLNKRGFRWHLPTEAPKVSPNYNICPTHLCLALVVTEGTLTFRNLRWGLVPSWAGSVKDADKYSMINAKSEEVTEKRSYRAAFQRRRCIVPVSGFYEWQRTESGKQPYAIYLKDEPIMSLAGLWEHWEDKEGREVVESFTIMTTAANSFVSSIHTRMPVILPPELESAWLDPEVTEPSAVRSLLCQYPAEKMKAHPVSNLVNSPRNNSPELILALST